MEIPLKNIGFIHLQYASTKKRKKKPPQDPLEKRVSHWIEGVDRLLKRTARSAVIRALLPPN